MLQRRKVRQDLFGRFPVERAQGEIVVLALPDSELSREVGKREELVRSIEILIIFSMTALHFTVVAGRVRTDEFVLDAEFGNAFTTSTISTPLLTLIISLPSTTADPITYL